MARRQLASACSCPQQYNVHVLHSGRQHLKDRHLSVHPSSNSEQDREETRGRNLASVLDVVLQNNANIIPVIFDFFILGVASDMCKLRRVQVVKTELLRPT
jgi:hypothetical protein